MLRGFYAILDVPGAEADVDQPAALDPLLARARRLLEARPCMLQVRAKSWGGRALAMLARSVLPAARGAGVPLCVNDRLDVALAVGADAVHLGQDDLPLADARLVAGARLTIGVSTHNPAQARAALAGRADYIGLGPVFTTGTKANPDPVVGVEGLRTVAAMARAAGIPVVAIGGITLGRVAALAAAGADSVALIGAIEGAADPGATARAVNAAFPVA
jgi:thiamine-phosphate pyrophosphorylase